MAQITVYMNYTIFFQDEGEYNSAVAIAGSPILEMCPADAAALFGIPYGPLPSGDLDQIPKGMYTNGPWTLDPPGSQINFPNPSGIIADPTVPSILVPGQAGSPASIFPAGPDGLHVWSATIIRSVGAGVAADPPVNAISQRRWACGFEHPSDLDLSSSNAVGDFTRDASRTPDGCGLRAGGSNNRFLTNTMIMFRAGLVTPTHWDRIYFRARIVPPTGASTIDFWRAQCSAGSTMGAVLRYRTDGTVNLININNAGTNFDKGVIFTPTVGQWYRIDILARAGSFPITQGGAKIYINGVFALGFDDTTGEGIGTGVNITSIQLGQTLTNTNIGMIDLDDWIGADLPANVNPVTLNFNDTNYPIDWLLGSHIRRHFPESASLTNWTPNDYAILGQDINPARIGIITTGATLSSTTSGAQIDGVTDAPEQSNPNTTYGLVLGAASAVISLHASNSGGTDGQVGYRLAGGAVVQSVVNQGVFLTNNAVMYAPTGMILPAEISPFHVIHTKSPDGNTDATNCLSGCVEYLGVWGPEDDPIFELPVSRLTNLHNCNYPNTEWGFFSSMPAAPVYAVGGTYVGNGLAQDITLPGPTHFVLIRRVGSAAGRMIFATSLGSHNMGSNEVFPQLRLFADSLGVYKLRIWSSDTTINANAATYQYIAFCDPGSRYNLCGVFGNPNGGPSPVANPLISPGFTADFGFVEDNLIQSGGFVGEGHWLKGPGITGNTFIRLSASGNDSGGNFGSGVFNSLTPFHNVSNKSNWVYSLWRTADGGASGCSNVMVQATTYVGNGVNPRNIPLTPISGRVPLFVWVQRSGANGAFRDPSHVGVNSALSSNFADIADGITAVTIDQITVSTQLNNNGSTYTVWAICGAVGGMLNGTYFPTYCVPPGGIAPSPPEGDIIVVSEGGLILNGTTPLLMLQDISGIYTLVPGKLNDTLQDRQTGQESVDVPILPIAKTGYIGG